MPFRTNAHDPYVGSKSRKTERRGAMEFVSLLAGKPDRAKHAFGLRFNQLSDLGENFGQGRAGKNQSLQVEHGLARKQHRLPRDRTFVGDCIAAP